MEVQEVRKMPLVSPKITCCSKKWIGFTLAKADHRKWAKTLSQNLPSGARPSPAQTEVLNENRRMVTQAREAYFAHIDDTSLEHR